MQGGEQDKGSSSAPKGGVAARRQEEVILLAVSFFFAGFPRVCLFVFLKNVGAAKNTSDAICRSAVRANSRGGMGRGSSSSSDTSGLIGLLVVCRFGFLFLFFLSYIHQWFAREMEREQIKIRKKDKNARCMRVGV